MGFNYDVFFSYRHKPLDGEITQKVFNAIESYQLPEAIRESGCENIRRAFRDTEELPVSRILTDTIDKALHSTNCLVVICSTDTPSSEWIDREVQTFIEIGRASHIYPLLITGDPEHSFPPSLKLVPDIAERVMDIRMPENNVKKMMAKADTELLRVISGIVGCREKDLLREHKMRKNRRFAARILGGAAAFAVVAGVSLGLMNLAQNYRDEAQRREDASMRILNELTYELPDHLTNVPGAYGRIAGILEQNTKDINAVIRLSADKEGAEFEAAANCEKLANARHVLGENEQALSAEEEAISIYNRLAEAGAEGAETALASADNNRGIILNAAGRYEAAAEAFRAAVERLEKQEEKDTLLMARMLYNSGANSVNLGSDEEAAEYFEKSLALLDTLEQDRDTLEAAAVANYHYGLLYYRSGKYAEAEEELERSAAQYEKLLEQVDSLNNRGDYVQTLSVLAACLADEGNFDKADSRYKQAITAAEELAADAENMEYSRTLARLYNNYALSKNIRGQYSEADALYERAAAIARTVKEHTGSAKDLAEFALYTLNLGENAFKSGDQSRSRMFFEEGLQAYRDALPELGDYDSGQYYAWMSYYELIHLRNYQEAINTALHARELQPNNVLVNLNLAYACLYGGYRSDAENMLVQIAALGSGMAETIRVDLAAQQQAGLPLENAEGLLTLLGLE